LPTLKSNLGILNFLAVILLLLFAVQRLNVLSFTKYSLLSFTQINLPADFENDECEDGGEIILKEYVAENNIFIKLYVIYMNQYFIKILTKLSLAACEIHTPPPKD
jgi:hypothetical protein